MILIAQFCMTIAAGFLGMDADLNLCIAQDDAGASYVVAVLEDDPATPFGEAGWAWATMKITGGDGTVDFATPTFVVR